MSSVLTPVKHADSSSAIFLQASKCLTRSPTPAASSIRPPPPTITTTTMVRSSLAAYSCLAPFGLAKAPLEVPSWRSLPLLKRLPSGSVWLPHLLLLLGGVECSCILVSSPVACPDEGWKVRKQAHVGLCVVECCS